MFNICGNLTIFEFLLLWTLVSPSEMQRKTFEKGTATHFSKIDEIGEIYYSKYTFLNPLETN